MKLRGIGAGRQVNAALDVLKKEVRLEILPTVVNPEPIARGVTDLRFEQVVEIHRDLGKIAILGRHRVTCVDLPAGEAGGAHAHHGEQGAGVLGKAGRERRGCGEFAEEGHPDSGRAGMLIDQDADNPPLLQHVGRTFHLPLAVEGRHPATAAVAVDQIVHEGVADRLVDASRAAGLHELGDLGVDLPVSEMAQGGDGASGTGFLPDDPILPVLPLVEGEPGTELLLAQGRDLHRAEDVGPEIEEMPQGDQGGLPSGQGGAEGNAEILFGESAVAGQNRPDQ